MFKIVASFTRPNIDHEFFNDLFMTNEVVVEIHKNADSIPGYLGIDENVYRDKYRCDKALCFENEDSFNDFVDKNQLLLRKRKQLIEEYCLSTGHEYKYYIIDDKDSLC
jgi:hypothetical protein